MKVADYIEQVAARFEQAPLCYGHGTDNALDEAAYLVCASLGIDFTDADILTTRELHSDEMAQLESRVSRRIDQYEPVAYITGQAWFAGHCFHADPRALIPRSPIAELIQNRFEPLLKTVPLRILDLCTGGGCIGIAAALEFTDAQVVLADISADALALAAENILLHGVQDRVTIVRSDLLENVRGKFDLILCNPPYVSRAEVDSLPAEYIQEPELGLLSADDGLEIPLQILQTAAACLHAEGLLVMEVGFSHALLAERLHAVPLLWLEFEHGGEGVFALTTSQLQQYGGCFS